MKGSYSMETIVVIGVGYVGLVASACFAHVGHQVICLDIDEKKIAKLMKGEVPFYEPNLEPLVLEGLRTNRLRFTTSYREALQQTSYVILAVDTPMQEDGSCNTTNIFRAARSLAMEAQNDLLVIVKSTVPVGTSNALEASIREVLQERKSPIKVELASNPEFLKEGDAVHDFMKPDRIILGVHSERAEEKIRRLYLPFNHLNNKFVVMDRASSEMTKYASNTMLALRISFMNWLSGLAEKTGADIDSVREGLGADSRIGPAFLRAGVGFGGSCFPKDIKALGHLAREHAHPSHLVDVIDEINEWQKKRFAERILECVKANKAEAPTIALLGLSFKPGTDDMRKAPSLTLLHAFLERGVQVRAFDPIAISNTQALLSEEEVRSITWCHDPIETAYQADAVVIVTEWPVIAEMNLEALSRAMRGNNFFDGRGLFKGTEVTLHGMNYYGLGKSPFLISNSEEQMAFAYLKKPFTQG